MYFKNHQTAKRIFDYFQEKYSLGVVGLWHVYGIASLHNKSDKVVLSSMVIAPAGMFKSSIMNDVIDVSKGKTFRVPDQPTDRGIVNFFKSNRHKMHNKMWTIEDAVTCFPSLEDTRQNRLVGLFVKVLMDGSYSYSDFSATNGMITRAGLYINVADENFSKIKNILKQSTFLERVIPFHYTMSERDETKVVRTFRRRKFDKPPKIKLKNTEVHVPQELDNELDLLMHIVAGNCSMSRSRANMFTCIILRSVAILEGRKEVTQSDVEFFKNMLMPYLVISSPLSPIERCMILMLSMNRETRFEECVNFFDTYVCKHQFPLDWQYFSKMPINELKFAFNRAKSIFKHEKDAQKIVRDVNETSMLSRNNK